MNYMENDVIDQQNREIELRTYKIQRELIEPNNNRCVTKLRLIQASVYLEPHHYQEVVTDRAVIGVCGYPICTKDIVKVPKYRISGKEGKVYDQTKLFDYCSQECLYASTVYAGQLSTESIFRRSPETVRVPVLHDLRTPEFRNYQTPVSAPPPFLKKEKITPVVPEFGSFVVQVREHETKMEPGHFHFKADPSAALDIEGYKIPTGKGSSVPKRPAVASAAAVAVTPAASAAAVTPATSVVSAAAVASAASAAVASASAAAVASAASAAAVASASAAAVASVAGVTSALAVASAASVVPVVAPKRSALPVASAAPVVKPKRSAPLVGSAAPAVRPNQSALPPSLFKVNHMKPTGGDRGVVGGVGAGDDGRPGPVAPPSLRSCGGEDQTPKKQKKAENQSPATAAHVSRDTKFLMEKSDRLSMRERNYTPILVTPEFPKMEKSHPEDLKMEKSHPEDLKIEKSHPEHLKMEKSHPEDLKIEIPPKRLPDEPKNGIWNSGNKKKKFMKEEIIPFSSEEWYSDDDDLTEVVPLPTLTDLEIGNFGFSWNALSSLVTENTNLFLNSKISGTSGFSGIPELNWKTRNSGEEEFYFPPVDSVSTEMSRRVAFDSLIRKYIDYINNFLKLSIPLHAEFELCVNTFHFHSPILSFTNTQWLIIALAIVCALKFRNYCDDFETKLETNLDQLCCECAITRVELEMLTGLLTGV